MSDVAPAPPLAPGDAPATHEELGALWNKVRDAYARLGKVAHHTPVMRSRTLDERIGAQVALKCESFQRMGAFKFRGAYNLISQLDEDTRARGVVAFSSGNHAQAVALVAQMFGIPATIVMPSTAVRSKLEAVRAYGAEVVHHDQLGEERDALAARLAQERGATLVPPFDHPDILAGQATAAYELFKDEGHQDVLLVPLGGGGLLSGSALVAWRWLHRVRVYGVEPAGGDDGARSLAAGRRVRVENPQTIADGARTPMIGRHTFPVIRALVDGILTVTDDEIVQAMRFAYERMKLVIEPTGALGLAALLANKVPRLDPLDRPRETGDFAGPGGGPTRRGGPAPAYGDSGFARVGVIVSGGNVDLDQLGRLFASTPR
jgi:threonine dehydratase